MRNKKSESMETLCQLRISRRYIHTVTKNPSVTEGFLKVSWFR